ncbi:MAG: methyltransferase domain-containing protein [Erysipelotrichaceae bacterium]|nr:methyltransferase domain-containing protein [Erysipelotrichaceae bacterium]
MPETYTTGQFAALARTTPRTLRFYDKKGLLKPSAVEKNGYRRYEKKDLLKLQKILLFRTLGFSLDEISYLLLEDSEDLAESFAMQSRMLKERIHHLSSIREAIATYSRALETGQPEEARILELLNLLAEDSQLLEQYRTAKNLEIRINLHSRYSEKGKDWFGWLFDNIDFSKVNRFLEVGAGSGQLWKERSLDLRHREIFLSDISEGMMEDARRSLPEDLYSFMVFPLQKIPFRSGYFDGVSANHVLFYLNDVNEGLKEICRVIRPGGVLYASAYGKNHMNEITRLVQEFDPSISLSSVPLYERFGIENGQELLQKHFDQVEFIPYKDSLKVTSARDLAEYILSCHGNQAEKLVGCYDEFLAFLEKRMKEKGCIVITKEVGLFKAVKGLQQ